MKPEEIFATPGLEAVAIEAEEMNLTEYVLMAACGVETDWRGEIRL